MVVKIGSLVAVLSSALLVTAQQSVWGQCGGIAWTGPTTCVSGSTCVAQNPYYSQCLPDLGTTTDFTWTPPDPGTTTDFTMTPTDPGTTTCWPTTTPSGAE